MNGIKRKKVAFIEPQAGRDLAYGYYLRKWPLLGCTIMATMLQQRGHDVKVYNENVSGSVLEDDAVLAELLEADFIGVAALTASVARAYQIAHALQKAGARARMVIGGPHVSFMPQEALQHFSYVVRGEGETVIAQLVEDEHPPNGIITAPPVENLDDLPTPDLTLMHKHDDLWKTSIWKDNYEIPLATSRGCPHNCKYCAVTKMYGRKCRFRSPEKVLQDIKFYYDKGFRAFFFYDDNFTAHRARTKRLLELITPMGIRWNAQCRIDFPWIDPASRSQIDERLMGALRASGVDVIYVGYETIDDATAAGWNKGYKGSQPLVNKMEEDTRILHDFGVWVHGMFVFGPQHDLGTFGGIVDFALQNRIDSLQISVLTPFPGTQTMEEMKNDLIFDNFPHDWRYFDGAHATFHHKKLGNKLLHESLLEYHRKYYHGAIHQLDRFRRMIHGRGSPYRKLVTGVNMALMVRRMFKTWHTENDAFIEEVRKRGEHYLHPAE